jgi:hypothetical protein
MFALAESHEFYDWHLNSWLTLNLGLRWDHFSPITADQGQRSNFDPALAAKCTATAPEKRGFLDLQGFPTSGEDEAAVPGGGL